jgi:hypothetical protein
MLPPCSGFGQMITAKKFLAVDKLAAANKAKMVFLSKDPIIPAANFSWVKVTYTADPQGTSGQWELDPMFWTLTGTTWKYRNLGAPSTGGTVRAAVVKPGKLKVVALGLGDSDDFEIWTSSPNPPPASIQIDFSNGLSTIFSSPVYNVIAGGSGAKLLAKNGEPPPPPVPAAIDAYRLYDNVTSGGPGIPLWALVDDFTDGQTELPGFVDQLLVPTEANSVSILAPGHFGACYYMPDASGAGPLALEYENQFDSGLVSPAGGFHVCLESILDGSGAAFGTIDHYRCYSASSPGPNVLVSLDDVLNPAEVVTLTSQAALCIPVSVDGSLRLSTLDALLCYGTDTEPPVPSPIVIDNVVAMSHTLTFGVPAYGVVCLPTRIEPAGCYEKGNDGAGGCNGCSCEAAVVAGDPVCATEWNADCVIECEDLQSCLITPFP